MLKAGLVFAARGNKEVSNYFSMLLTSSYDEREYGHAGNSLFTVMDPGVIYKGGFFRENLDNAHLFDFRVLGPTGAQQVRGPRRTYRHETGTTGRH